MCVIFKFKNHFLFFTIVISLIFINGLSLLSNLNNVSFTNAQDCGLCESWALDIENNFLYSAARIGFDIFEINSDGSLSYINSYESIDYWGTKGLAVNNDILAVETRNLNSTLFNVSGPSNIIFLSNVSFGYNYLIHNNFLYVCSGYDGLNIYNISMPKQPVLLNYTRLEKGGIDKAFIEGEFIYLICKGFIFEPYTQPYNAFAIFDISTPSNPKLVILEDVFFNQPLYDIYVKNGNIFLTTEGGFYHCFLIDDILILDMLRYCMPYSQIVFKDDFLFIGTDPIYVYDIKDPSDPIYLNSFRGLSHTWDMAVYEEKLYFANGEDGIGIIEIKISYTSSVSISILIGFDLSLICAGFAFAIVCIILLKSKSKKKC